MTHIIDWNEIWKLAHSSIPPVSDPWKDRAERFDKHIHTLSRDTNEMVTKLNCKPTDTVLDIGAGTGRFSIPISKQAASVTAIEPSATMRKILGQKVVEQNISNMVTIPLPWEHITIGKDIQPHDIVLASHSITMHDLKAALLKINQAAKREVWLVLFAGNKMESWIHDILMKAGIDPSSKKRPFDYLIVYSILHSLQIYADIEILTYEFLENYPDAEAAVEDWRLMYNVSPDNEIFSQEIKRRLICTGDRCSLARTSRLAAIHWRINSDIHLD